MIILDWLKCKSLSPIIENLINVFDFYLLHHIFIYYTRKYIKITQKVFTKPCSTRSSIHGQSQLAKFWVLWWIQFKIKSYILKIYLYSFGFNENERVLSICIFHCFQYFYVKLWLYPVIKWKTSARI